MCFTQTSVINLTLLSEQHSPQVTEPNLILPQNSPYINLCCGRRGGSKDSWKFSARTSSIFSCAWGICSSDGTERPGRSATSNPKTKKEYMEKFPYRLKFFLTILKTSFIKSKITIRIKVSTPAFVARTVRECWSKNTKGILMNRSKWQES